MFNTIEEYLDALKAEMKGSDSALLQDALADAREHLSTALDIARQLNAELNEADALKTIVDEYGTPEETASAYKEVERRTSPSIKQSGKPRSVLSRFFGIYEDPKAWGSLLYMLISLVTGIVYFTWVVTGLSLSLSLAIFIFGLVFAIFFIFSLRGLALLEGRLVESLLGVRMPRRPLFIQKGTTWFESLKTNLMDKHVWLALVYLFLQMPLGIIYFTMTVTLFSLSIGLMSALLLQLIFRFPIVSFGSVRYFLPVWSMPVFVLVGFLLWTVTMHIGKFIGTWHGRYAKWMLVSE
ncbi:MAG: sensor domain-containing protein [Anaerolineales bacterium]|nr:sensor domain-containing protein [Anaerolineales bacterium]